MDAEAEAAVLRARLAVVKARNVAAAAAAAAAVAAAEEQQLEALLAEIAIASPKPAPTDASLITRVDSGSAVGT